MDRYDLITLSINNLGRTQDQLGLDWKNVLCAGFLFSHPGEMKETQTEHFLSFSSHNWRQKSQNWQSG